MNECFLLKWLSSEWFSLFLGAFLSGIVGVSVHFVNEYFHREALRKAYLPILRQELKNNIIQITKLSQGEELVFTPELWLRYSLELATVLPEASVAYQKWLGSIYQRPLTSYVDGTAKEINYTSIIDEGYRLLEESYMRTR